MPCQTYLPGDLTGRRNQSPAGRACLCTWSAWRLQSSIFRKGRERAKLQSWKGGQPQLSSPSRPMPSSPIPPHAGPRSNRTAASAADTLFIHAHHIGTYKNTPQCVCICVLCRHNNGSFDLQATHEGQAGNATVSAAELGWEEWGARLGARTHQPLQTRHRYAFQPKLCSHLKVPLVLEKEKCDKLPSTAEKAGFRLLKCLRKRGHQQTSLSHRGEEEREQ